uniref:hypothetical protein n=1 Tax=Castellaniella defragrans TaxID=75697 RepID=UPI00333EF813
MNELKSFLERLGGLHDAVVRQLVWEPEARTLRLEIVDLCWNFEGLPEYPGAVPGAIVLRGVDRIGFGLHIGADVERLNIYEFSVKEESADEYWATISFWPSGYISAVYRAADFPVVELRRVGHEDKN